MVLFKYMYVLLAYVCSTYIFILVYLICVSQLGLCMTLGPCCLIVTFSLKRLNVFLCWVINFRRFLSYSLCWCYLSFFLSFFFFLFFFFFLVVIVIEIARNERLWVRKLDILNPILLGKQLWRFEQERNHLWKWVSWIKYGEVRDNWHWI